MPMSRAACNARITFGDLPEVVIPINASPGRPRLLTMRSKYSSKL